ncbi:MAG: O-antigen ligase family protein [Armatimonadetes bacterium]|nr:O-antigen ligase family protein [Armatimonadota bacterium]
MRSGGKGKRNSRSYTAVKQARTSYTPAIASCIRLILSVPFAVIAALVVIAPLVWSFPELPTLELHPMRTPSALSFLVLTLAILGILAHLLRMRLGIGSNVSYVDSANVALFAFVILCAISCLDSISLWDSAIEMVNTFSFAVAFIIASLAGANWALVFLLALLLGVYIEGLISLREYCLSYAAGLKDWRAFGTFQNPNLLGGYMGMCIPVAVALALHFKCASLKLICWLVATVCALSLVVSGSKGAFAALLVSAGAFAWLSIRQARLKSTIAFALTSAFALLLIVALIPTLRHRIVAAFSEQAHSWLFRLFVWGAAVNIALSHPINGTGIGTFHFVYPRFTEVGPTFMAHNAFLQIASECGVTAMLTFIAFIGLCLFSSAQLVKRCEDEYRWLRIGSFCACISFISHNLVDCTWYVPAARFAFALLLACCMTKCTQADVGATHASHKHAHSDNRFALPAGLRMPIKIGVGSSIAVVAILVPCAFVSLSHIVAVSHALTGRNSESILSAIESFERAIIWEPFNARHRVALANAYLALARYEDGGNLKRALSEALTAVRLQPMRGANYHTLAKVYIAIGNRPKAIEAYRSAIEVNPHDTLAMLELGRLLELMDDKRGAVKMYERIIHLMRSPYGQYRAIDAPTDVSVVAAAANLASLKLRCGAAGNELLKLKSDLKLAANLGEAYLGFFHPQMNEAVGAKVDEVKRWLALVYAYLAVVYGHLGETVEAERAKRRAIELNPSINLDELLGGG